MFYILGICPELSIAEFQPMKTQAGVTLGIQKPCSALLQLWELRE